MIKKLVALTAALLFSLNASAGYVQYDFSGPLQGYVVQNDDDQSIAYYQFLLPLEFDIDGTPFRSGFNVMPLLGEGVNTITDESTYFRNNGPTNFTLVDEYTFDQKLAFSIDFARSAGGRFSYSASYHAALLFWDGWRDTHGTHAGLVTKGTVEPSLALYLDSVGGYMEGVPAIVPRYIGPANPPNPVPEPAGLALLALGALGAFGAARRKSQQ